MTCALGEIASGDTVRVRVQVVAPKKPGKLVNVARVAGDQDDPDLGGNSVTSTTKVRKG